MKNRLRNANVGGGAPLTLATQDSKFVSICKKLNIPPSRRQYNKYLRKTGLAFQSQGMSE